MSRWVLFDAVGTVIYPEPSVANIYLEVGRRHGWSAAEDDLPQRFSAAMSEQFVAGSASDENSDYQSWRRVVQQVMLELPDESSSAAFMELWDHFARPSSWRVYLDVGPCWQRLAEQGYQLAIASNFDRRLVGIAAGHAEFSQVQRVFVSSQLGWSKPDPRFYRTILDELRGTGEHVDEFWMVGDDYRRDVQAAVESGIDAVWLRRDIPPSENSIASLRTPDLG